jgi:hypothetical protein
MVDYYDPYKMICRVFSLPFKFHRLEHIGNNIPNIIFNSVTHLKLWDKNAFKHEFFIRLARAFPFLQNLSIWNIKPAFLEIPEYHLRHKDWCSIIEYPHLISLDIECVNLTYVEYLLIFAVNYKLFFFTKSEQQLNDSMDFYIFSIHVEFCELVKME